MSQELEKIILTLMLNDNDFSSKVFPYFKTEYFQDTAHHTIAVLFKQYREKYSDSPLPSHGALEIELSDLKGLSQETFQTTNQLLTKLYDDKIVKYAKELSHDHIIEKTERYFKQQSCMLAVYKAIDILEQRNGAYDAIPDILQKAVAVSFDVEIGHDYLRDAEYRFEQYHKTEATLPFKLTALNLVCGGGCGLKSLIVPVAPTGVGKSLFMTDWSSYLLSQGHNVLYITLELSEIKIAERIDMNLMDVTKEQLTSMPSMTFKSKVKTLKANTIGSLKIKEYVPGVFNANHLRHLLRELKSKENFVPRVVMIDYLNLMASYRSNNSSEGYSYIKAIAEEIRGVAMEYDLIVCSPTQTNRSGANVNDFNLTEISESFGIAMTADVVFGLIQTEEMAKNNQIRVKQLKNRWGDINRPSSFMISANKSKMQLSDLDDISGYFNKKNKELSADDFAIPVKESAKSVKSNPHGLNFDE